MKKRQFSKKLTLSKTKISNYQLQEIKGMGTHYEWCEDGYTAFPCNIK